MPFFTLTTHKATRPGRVGSYLHEAGWGSIVTSLSQAGQTYNPIVNPSPSPLNVGGDTRGAIEGKAIYAPSFGPKVLGRRGNGAPRKTARRNVEGSAYGSVSA